VTPEKVNRAVRRIVEVAHPLKLILFGSYIHKKLHENSDLDVWVVTDNSVRNSRAESVRIRKALGDIHMPMDIVVVTEDRLNALKDTPGLIFREALRSGTIVYPYAA